MRDAAGNFLTAARVRILASNVGQAEALALFHGCQLGLSLGFIFFILESDSLKSISSSIYSLENGKWEAYPTLAKVRQLGGSFQDCHWSWVRKLANIAVDWMVSERFPKMSDVSWVKRPPSSLVNVLNKDGLPYAP